MKKIFSVRGILTLFLLLSIGFAGVATYYKITHWGFSINPKEKTDVWTIDAHISFTPLPNENIEVVLATPRNGDEYKILSEEDEDDGSVPLDELLKEFGTILKNTYGIKKKNVKIKVLKKN